ncbi:hypothetical protein BD289DRAFT_370734 [Coniella lustricola]|uniref:DUF7703 domain-containing protein n=1 Tax=Coniella lustricola TaxID=2025994 RepID=A0A2T3A4V1_9PEZI|nr:hypothetical protein BD289DRAFT_370734 [Coniella lustricola]
MSINLPFIPELPRPLHRWAQRHLVLPPHQTEPVVAQDISRGLLFALACLIGIGLWNASETLVLIWWSFNRRRNLYFWSIIAAALGTLLCVTSQVINLGTEHPNETAILAIGLTGWVPMVTGQSLVLYSRLHLLWNNERVLRMILAMIIVNGIALHGSNIAISIVAANNGDPQVQKASAILEKLEIAVFFLQGVFLSGLYLWRSSHFLKQYGRQLESDDTDAMTRMLRWLMVVNLVLIILDCSILITEYLSLHVVQLTVKNFIYSVKLRIELSTLSGLRNFIQHFRRCDSVFLRKEKRRRQESIQRQWELALQRAFGTTNRQRRSTLTMPPEEEEEEEDPTAMTEGRQILFGLRRMSSPFGGAPNHV